MNGRGVTYGDVQPSSAAGSMQAFACPSAVQTNNTSGRVLHYASHPRLMPLLHNTDLAIGQLARPYKASQVKRSSEVILVFDAIQNLTAEGNVVLPACIGLDEDGYYRNDTQQGRRWNFPAGDERHLVINTTYDLQVGKANRSPASGAARFERSAPTRGREPMDLPA